RVDERPYRGVAPGGHFAAPGVLHCGDLTGECGRGGRAVACRGDEEVTPAVDAATLIHAESVEVSVAAGGEHDADGRHIPRGQPATDEDDVDEAAAGTAVAVGERVDGLKLSVGDRRLNHCGQVVAS